MAVIETRVDTGCAAFAENRARMVALIDDFRAAEARVRAHSERARERFDKRGQLLPRDRMALLLDRGTPFVELSTLAGYGIDDDDGAENASGGAPADRRNGGSAR